MARREDKIGLIGRIRRWVRYNRVELGLGYAVVVAQAIGVHVLGYGNGTLLVLAGSLVAWRVPVVRTRLEDVLGRATRNRRWQAGMDVLMPTGTPAVGRIDVTAFGETALIRLGAGWSPTQMESMAERIASYLDVAAVTVNRVPGRSGWVSVSALVTDPLSRPSPAWPWLGAGRTDLWEPVPLGLDSDGREVTVTLPGHNLLLGGEPGAGKSGTISMLVAAAALDPSVSVWLMDGKLVELAPWAPIAAGFAGTDITEAIVMLRSLSQVVDERYAALLAEGKRKVDRDKGLHVVVCDELAHYLTWPEKKARDAFTDGLRDLVSRGRAAGVIVIAATQKPGSEVVPTSLRDLFGYRAAMRCSTSAASDTILGSGWATQGYSAGTIDPGLRGVGYLLHESGVPVRLRTHWLDDNDVSGLIARARALRGGESGGAPS